MPVFLNNFQEKISIEDSLLELLNEVVNETLRRCGAGDDPEVGLVLVDDDYMAGLNRRYRGVDRPTDVLSFAMLEGEPMPEGGQEAQMLGDVVISLETARRQAEELGHGLTREVAYLTAHGVLHLLGYHHGTEPEKDKMRQMEEAVLNHVIPGGGR